MRAAEAREAQAVARERAALLRSALAGLGAAGDDLSDAVLLIDRALSDQPDADEDAVAAAAEQLKERRPELFGSRAAAPPAPGGSPAGDPPSRGGVPPKPGAAGRAMVRRRGFISD
ncbi:hypothetical protein ACFY71_40365 [Streptomyces cinerochromogenes]|uniref:hypothetical protein n=1 Tax=Streptomyces cinerochromogenes TaxID=66422 RepID=UPI0036A985EC